MPRNFMWIVFLSLVILIGIWFIGRAAKEIFSYTRFSKEQLVSADSYRVVEKKSDLFVIEAHYSFEFDGKIWTGFAPVKGSYPNRFAAENDLKKWRDEKELLLFFDPSHPERVTFNKKFPYKSTFSSLLLIGIAVYFYLLGAYAKRGNS